MVAHLTKTLELLLSASHTSSLVLLPYSLTYLPSEFCICSSLTLRMSSSITTQLALSILRISVLTFSVSACSSYYNRSSSSHTSSSSGLSTMQLVLACCVCYSPSGTVCLSQLQWKLSGAEVTLPSNTRMMSEIQA